MSKPPIQVRGCRVHNLRDVDVDIPRGKLVVLCGVSGSGKTSLALDTLYAEGQRSYIESFSAYARQYLERLDKPECEEIIGIPPAIAVTRKGTTRSNRSTVGSTTDIADHLRLMFAKASDLVCYQCGQPVVREDPEAVANSLNELPDDSRSIIGFPVWLKNKKAATEILFGLQQEGYTRLIVAGQTYQLSEEDRQPLAKQIRSPGVEAIVVVDRVGGRDDLSRLTESLETAMTEGYGRAIVLQSELIQPTQVPPDPAKDIHNDRDAQQFSESNGKGGQSNDGVVRERVNRFAVRAETQIPTTPTMEVDGRTFYKRVVSESLRCETCELEFPDPVPRFFNANHPLGACPTCEGFGDIVDVDMDLVVPDRGKTIREGAIAPWTTPAYQHENDELMELADDYGIPVDVPFSKLSAKHLKLIHQGVPERNFGGLDGFFRWLDRKKYKMHVRVFAARFRSYRRCPSCQGQRLKPEALSFQLKGHSIADLLNMRADQLVDFLRERSWTPRQQEVIQEPKDQVIRRLGYLSDVGLGYLQLSRALRTLSGGETQRVALTAALGSSLVNMLYVLDEPTSGLHPRDVDQLCKSIVGLRDRGNTVVVVEHDETLIREADELIEVGPEAGSEGGRITFHGSPKQLLRDTSSLTGKFLRGERGTTMVNRRPREARGWIKLHRARGNNLQEIDVDFPLGVLCLVTGVSGSGKSSLVHDTLYHAVQEVLGTATTNDEKQDRLPYDSLTGISGVDACMMIDQSAISRSARSCPVTYVKAFDSIRKVFAETVSAKTLNLSPGHFSFNSAKGQCPECEGAGVLEVDMQFLADVSMQCLACRGTRFRDEILQIKFRDRSIADVLAMTTAEAYLFFRGYAKVQAKLKRMKDVGLDYITLGQSATTLSSGEAQRLKLAAFLASATRKRTLFLMDEPTTGLHFADIVRLVDCFDALIADGHSLIVVEHNAMLMNAADHLIDLGPGAAELGGRVIASGPPEMVRKVSESATASVLV